MDNNFGDSEWRDPFDRLNDIEGILENMAWQLEHFAEQHSANNKLLLKITENLKFLAANNSSLHLQTQALHHRLKILEDQLNEK